MKKILVLFLVLTMALGVLAACNGSETDTSTPPTSSGTSPTNSPAPTTAPIPSGEGILDPGDVIQPPDDPDVKYADFINILVDQNIAVVDPLNPAASSLSTRTVNLNVFDRLVRLTAEGTFEEQLATSWDTDDWKTFTFTLREGVTFHNGDKFTAQSVIDTCTVSNDTPGSRAIESWGSVESITAINDYTVEIVLKAVNTGYIYSLTQDEASIVNKAAREADPVAGAWIGTGPFYVSDFLANDYTTLVRNDSYWGDPPPTRQLNLRHIPEMQARTIMMQNGEAHICFVISPDDMHIFVNDPDNYTIYRMVGSAAHSLAFNMNDPITGDLNFRKAVACALVRADVALVSAGEWGYPDDRGTFWGNWTEYIDLDIPQLPYDLELAKQYLNESSYNGEEVEIVSGIPVFHRGAEAMAAQLGAIGINVKLFATDVPTLLSHARYADNQAQIAFHVYPFTARATSARLMLSPGGAHNRASYNNPEVTDLLTRAPGITDPAEREAAYKQIQAILAEELPYINLYWRVQGKVTSSDIGGVIVDQESNYDYRFMYRIEG